MFYEFSLFIIRNDVNTGRQGSLHGGDFLIKVPDDFGRVLAIQLENHAGDDFLFTIARDDAAADFAAVVDLGHITDPDRNTVNGFNLNIPDIIKGLQQAQAAHGIFLAAEQHKLAAGVAIVIANSRDDIREADGIFVQAVGINPDLVLQDMAADGEDIGNAGNSLQLIFDDPVINFTQPGIRFFTFGIRAGIAMEIIDKNLA